MPILVGTYMDFFFLIKVRQHLCIIIIFKKGLVWIIYLPDSSHSKVTGHSVTFGTYCIGIYCKVQTVKEIQDQMSQRKQPIRCIDSV